MGLEEGEQLGGVRGAVCTQVELHTKRYSLEYLGRYGYPK